MKTQATHIGSTRRQRMIIRVAASLVVSVIGTGSVALLQDHQQFDLAPVVVAPAAIQRFHTLKEQQAEQAADRATAAELQSMVQAPEAAREQFRRLKEEQADRRAIVTAPANQSHPGQITERFRVIKELQAQDQLDD